jgi:hypothetical protein
LIQAAFPRFSLSLAAALLFLSASARAETIWSKDNDFVRIEKADGGTSPGNLPKLSPDAVRAVLAAVQVNTGSETRALLSDGQLELVAGPISRALAQAAPGQDVTFAVHEHSSMFDYLGPPRTTAGRLFLDGDAVGVIIGMVHGTFLAGGLTIDTSKIRTGSRLVAQDTEDHIVPNAAVSLAIAGRNDWARVSPAAWSGTFGTPMAYSAAPAPAPAAAMAAPAAPAAPASPALLAAPVPQDPSQIEQRFAALKRLLDAHMISQEDYDRSKADLLKAMSTPK